MIKTNYESQFSIYKVDYDRAVKYLEEEKNGNVQSYNELQKVILNKIKEEVLEYNQNKVLDVDSTKFVGLVFKTFHYPSWRGMISNILEEDFDISNTHISYVLSYLSGENLFLLTGGLGSNYINEYIKKNYGLYLLPKIMKENNPVVKSVLENRLSGNRLSSKHSNRNATTINIENDMSAIFRELSLEIDKDIIGLLGIEIDENKKTRNLNLIAKDSFVIRKSINLEVLAKVLDTLVEIEQRKDNFSLGYFVDVKKYGYSSKQLNEILLRDFVDQKIDNFILVGDDYSDYCIGGNRYVIQDSDYNILYEDVKPLTLKDVFDNCLLGKISKTSIERLLKCYLVVYSDSSIILHPTKLKQCIQGYVEDDNGSPFFLFNGNWLMFDDNYVGNLDSEFKKIFDQMTNLDKNLCRILHNENISLTEDAYNKTFCDSNDIIVAHTVRSNNIELADLIYYDDDNLYLIHNKSIFQGNGARDVLNQILTSAEFINHYSMEKDRRKMFEEYYDGIINTYPNNKKINSLSKSEFVDLFSKANIYYVAGFMENLSINSRSNYAKYLTLDISKKLLEKGYELFLFDINGR